MQQNRPNIVACIPAYNEERAIASVIIKTQRYVDRVIVCDDGSTDMVGVIAEKLGVEVIKHEINSGYGAALSTLFKKAREVEADITVVIDADGQHNPDDIPSLIEPLTKGEADIVIGSRFLGKNITRIPTYRKVGIKAITRLTNEIAYNGLSDSQSGFRAYNKKAVASIKPTEMGMGASTEILLKAHEFGFRIKEVPIKISYGKGTSTQNPVYHGLDVILSTIKHLSIRHSLLFYGLPGLASIIMASVFWFWTLQTFVETRQIITNVTLIAVATTLVGLLLMTTAIILWVIISVIRENR